MPGEDLSYVINDIYAQLSAQAAKIAALQNYQAGLDTVSTWVPIVAQGATNNIAKTIRMANYTLIGSWVLYDFYLEMTGAGTANNKITVTLPVNVKDEGGAYAESIGVGWIYSSAHFWGDHWRCEGATGATRNQIACWSHKDGGTVDDVAIGATGASTTAAIVAGTVLQGSGWYRWK